jgi:hypothetical protein
MPTTDKWRTNYRQDAKKDAKDAKTRMINRRGRREHAEDAKRDEKGK